MKTEGTLFSALHEVDAPAGLYAAILARIAQARQQSARVKTLWLGITSLLFGVSLVPALQYAGQELYTSGFYTYASLLFSDSKFAFSAWREFSLSLLESLPAIALLLVFACGVALCWSLYRTFKNARVAFSF